jgi:hypothetical protein
MKSINEQLHELYASKWEAISEALQKIAEDGPQVPAHPLLLYVDNEEAWLQADLRVMIFGQEPNGWEADDDTIESICAEYDKFFYKGGYRKKSRPFWHGICYFLRMLAEKFPDKKIQYLWNNIVKIGNAHDKGRPVECIREQERTLFRVIPGEMNILKPNVVLFLSGPRYDDVIRENFAEVSYAPLPPYTERQLAKLSIPEIPSAELAFRTYHPGYLFRNDINSYFGAIIDEIAR